MSDFCLGLVNLESKALKKELDEQLMLILWHSRRWWNFCKSEDEKKEEKKNFYWVMLLVGIQFESIEIFCHTGTWYSSEIFVDI